MALDEFSPDARTRDGKQSRCKACQRELRKEWRETNPELAKAERGAFLAANPGYFREHYSRNKSRCKPRACLQARPRIACCSAGRAGKTFLHVRNVVFRALKAPGSRHGIFRFRALHVHESIVLDTFPKVMKLAFPGVGTRCTRATGTQRSTTGRAATARSGSPAWTTKSGSRRCWARSSHGVLQRVQPDSHGVGGHRH
jgi:hypothetical protein